MFEAWKARRLIRELHSGSIRENSDTVDKLRSIGPPAVKPLIKALASKAYRVKLESIRALGYIGDPRAIPALLPFLKHRNEVVREFAEAALKRMGALQGNGNGDRRAPEAPKKPSNNEQEPAPNKQHRAV